MKPIVKVLAIAGLAGAGYLAYKASQPSGDQQFVGSTADTPGFGNWLGNAAPAPMLNFDLSAPDGFGATSQSQPSFFSTQAAGAAPDTTKDAQLAFGTPVASAVGGGILVSNGQGGVVPASFQSPTGTTSTKKSNSSGGGGGASYGFSSINYTPAPKSSGGGLNYTPAPKNYTPAPTTNYTPAPKNYTPAPTNYTLVPKNYTPAPKKA